MNIINEQNDFKNAFGFKVGGRNFRFPAALQVLGEAPPEGYTAKSIIIDCTDNWGGPTIGLRSIEFKFEGTLVVVLAADGNFYHSSAGYDPEQAAVKAFDTSLSKTGSRVNTSWYASSTAVNSRIVAALTDAIIFDEVVVNNYHHSGTVTNWGLKNTKINISTDTITDTTYNAAIANSTLIFDGEIAEHPATDTVDDQVLSLI